MNEPKEFCGCVVVYPYPEGSLMPVETAITMARTLGRTEEADQMEDYRRFYIGRFGKTKGQSKPS